MSQLNLKQTCLLDASGELTPEARKELLDRVTRDPEANNDYQNAHAALSLLSMLPIPEPSAAERRAIPLAIKQAIHAALERPVKEARRLQSPMRYAMAAGLLLVVAATGWMLWAGQAAETRRHLDQFTRITASTEHLLPAGEKSNAYDLAVTDVEASIRQLETESPTLSHVYDKNMANLLDALASVPQPETGEETWPAGETN
jgi:hypothetical protein